MDSERKTISRILNGSRSAPFVRVPNGDDGAVLSLGDSVVLSVDAQVEGVHFKRSFGDWYTLGRRGCLAALSDLAAMGASPRAVLSSLVLPSDLSDDDVDAIVRGIDDGARSVGAVVAGGNLAAGPVVVIDTTVIGDVKHSLKRSGAELGQCIALTCHPGHAALGLNLLLRKDTGREIRKEDEKWVAAWQHPHLRFDLATHASAAIDLSDGLAIDLLSLALASECRVQLREATLKSLAEDRAFATACQGLGLSPQALVLGGGESYALALAMAEEHAEGLVVIADIIDGDTGVYKGDHMVTAEGYDHFEHSTE